MKVLVLIFSLTAILSAPASAVAAEVYDAWLKATYDKCHQEVDGALTPAEAETRCTCFTRGFDAQFAPADQQELAGLATDEDKHAFMEERFKRYLNGPAPAFLDACLSETTSRSASDQFWNNWRAGIYDGCRRNAAPGSDPAVVREICACVTIGFEKSLESERAAIDALPTDDERGQILTERFDSYWNGNEMDPFVAYCRTHLEEFGIGPQ